MKLKFFLAFIFLFTVLLALSAKTSNASHNPSFFHLTAGVLRLNTTAVTAAMSIPANQLALIWIGQGSGSTATVTDPQRTWTLVATSTPGQRRLSLFQSLEAVDTNSQVTMNHSTNNEWTWTVAYALHSPIVQYGSAFSQSLVTSGSVTLPSVGSGPVAGAFLTHRNALPVTAGSGYTLLGPNSCTFGYSVICVQAESREDFSQTVNMSWTNPSHWIGIGAEL